MHQHYKQYRNSAQAIERGNIAEWFMLHGVDSKVNIQKLKTLPDYLDAGHDEKRQSQFFLV